MYKDLNHGYRIAKSLKAIYSQILSTAKPFTLQPILCNKQEFLNEECTLKLKIYIYNNDS